MNRLRDNMAAPQRSDKFAEDCSLAVLLQPFEMTPKQLQLLEAARKNDVTELEQLLTKRVNVNSRNHLDRTALHWAAANGNADAIDVLLRAAANVNATDKYGMTPLLLASWFGHVTALEKLARNKKIVINCFNKQEMNAIHCAAANDHINVLEFFNVNQLIEKIDINKPELRGKTPLQLAAEKGFEETVDYLLTIGSDPSPTDLTGRTALHLAAAGGHNDVTSSLLQIHGQNINQADNEGFTALHLASAAGHGAVVHLLISANADLNAQTQKGMSALTLASAGGHLVTASQLLMDSLCDRNHQNEDGNTALHLASSNDNVNIVRLLIAKGCDVNLANKLGQTALHIGAEMGHSPIVQLLLASRADPTRRDGAGKRPLALASRANHVSVVDMIIKKERLQEFRNDTATDSECDPRRVADNRNPSLSSSAVDHAARCQEDVAEGRETDQEEDENSDDLKSVASTRHRQQSINTETQSHESENGNQEQAIQSVSLKRGTIANDIDKAEGASEYHDNLDDLGEPKIGQRDRSENSNRPGATDGNNSPTHSLLTPVPNSERRDSGDLGGCYSNTGFSLDEIIELRAGSRHSAGDRRRFPVQHEDEPVSKEDATSVLDSDGFLATSSTVGDADHQLNSTVGEADPEEMSLAVGRPELPISSDHASDSRVVATDSVPVDNQLEEPHPRNFSRSNSNQSQVSGIFFQTRKRLESDSSVFQETTDALLEDMNDLSGRKEPIAMRRQSSVDRMLAMKEVLWKLATSQLRQGEWKRIARHWQFTDEQIRAIEHQHTGLKSHRDHGYRMLVIWLECYLELNPPPNGNPLRGLFDALVAVNRRKLAEQIRQRCNRSNETRKACIIS